jgi:diacylglycerol kinase (ATP)
MRVKVIANPAAGRDEPILGVLNNAFGASGVEWDLAVTHEAGDAQREAGTAGDEGFDVVAAYGGDGTVAGVAAGLVDNGLPLAILPGGTANVMAAELGLPSALADAAALLAGGAYALRKVDMAQAGGCPFLLRMGLGFEVLMMEGATQEMKAQYGTLAYFLSGFRALVDPPAVVAYEVDVDGSRTTREGMACIVANSGSTGIGDIRLAPGIDVSDGLLDVLVVDTFGLDSLLGVAGEMAAGHKPGEMWHAQGRTITVRANAAQRVICDGEPAGESPVTVRVMPAAIRVVVPA